MRCMTVRKVQVRAEEVCEPENGRGFPAWNSGKAGEGIGVPETGHGRSRRESAASLSVDSTHRKRHVLYAAGRDGGITLLSGSGGGKCICSQ